MISNYTDRNICLMILFIFLMGNLTNLVAKSLYGINVKHGIHVLYRNCQSFKTHACIDVLLFQSGVITVAVIFELGKYIIPYFHVAVAVTARGTVRLSAAVFLSTIVIHFRTWATGSCPMLPEIILLAESVYSLGRNTYFLIPDFKSLIVISVNRWIKSVFIKSHNFCKEFPGPVKGFLLKIITKGKIAQHFKKGAVTCGFSHVFNVTGTDTFLTGGNSGSWRSFNSCEVWLKRRHTGIYKKKALVILGNEGEALQNKMSIFFIIIEEHLP